MTDYSNLLTRPLDSNHYRPGFHCGVASLDDYIQRQARQTAQLLVDAIKRTLAVSDEIAIYARVVDATDDRSPVLL